MPDTGKYLGMVALNLHPPATPIPELATSQLVIDQFMIDGQSGGQSLNNRDERSSV
nr:hypothetical protein [uncultured bacterium]